jgi:peptidoglycan-associated lipoprotein
MKHLVHFLFLVILSTSFGQELEHVIVKDKETGLVLSDVQVEFKDKSTNKIIVSNSDVNGLVITTLPKNRKFVVTTELIGYDPIMFDYITSSNSILPIEIKIRKTSPYIMVRLDNVLYEYDKSNLSAAGKTQLTILYKFLKENPKFLVEINSHTDARGQEEYNMNLSAHRSLSCFNYLRGKNLKTARMVMKNYGETQLLNECGDDVDCPDDLHQVNRRTDFVLMFPKD